jgi:hypothetical protein
LKESRQEVRRAFRVQLEARDEELWTLKRELLKSREESLAAKDLYRAVLERWRQSLRETATEL